MKKIIPLLTIIIAFVACSSRNGDKIQTNTEQQGQSDSIQISVDKFTNIPQEIDGCACLFYLSEQDEIERKYIFVNDFANIAFVSINGKVLRFELTEHNEKSQTYFYSNGEYNLKIEIVAKEDGEYENSAIRGNIFLSKDSRIVKRSFIGNCGC